MTETRQVLCDTCGADITYTGNSVDYRVLVTSESLGGPPGVFAVTDMMIHPPIPEPLHFCNERCLVGSDWFARMIEWRDKLAARA